MDKKQIHVLDDNKVTKCEMISVFKSLLDKQLINQKEYDKAISIINDKYY